MDMDAPENELSTTGTADFTLIGTFHLFGMQEELAIGADFRHQRGTYDTTIVGFGTRSDIRFFDLRNYPEPPVFPNGSGTVGARSAGEAGAMLFCTDDGCPRLRQKSYAVLDVRAAFQIDRDWRLALSVNNVFDKTYYAAIDPFTLRSWYGAPRNVTLRVDGKL